MAIRTPRSQARNRRALPSQRPTAVASGWGVGRLGRALVCGVVLAGLLGLSPGTGRAQQAPPASPAGPDAGSPVGPVGPPPAEILALLDSDPERQWAALAALRADAAAARLALVAALQREEPLPERWRLVYRMVEFGLPEDVPLLLQVREQALNAWERRIVHGAVRALYDPVGAAPGLDSVIQDFSFIQTRPPTQVQDENRGRWLLSRWSLGDYHRDDLPLRVINRLTELRGRPFDSREKLAEALQKRLRARDWKEHGERLLASAESVPARIQLEGLARIRLQNPLDRPLLLVVALGAWYGEFREPPGTAWVYLEPSATVVVDLPVAPRGSRDRPQMRMDLRLLEVDGEFIPGFHKLYLPLQP